MLFPRTLLTAVGAALLLPTGIAQIASQPSVNLPRTIRLCGAGLCQTLTWNDGHYDGRLDGQTNASTTFGVVRWDREAVDLVGIVSRPTPNGDYVTGIFKGTISQGGNRVDDGTDNWRAGGATGSLPFKMTWSPDDPVRPFSLAAAATLPKLMRLCASKCVVLKLNGGNFDVYEENDPATKTATYLVSSFSSDAVFLELLVPNGIRAIVTGKVQGETMAEAKLTFLNGFDGITAPLEVGWGDELMAVAPIAPPQQTVSVGAPQQQINPLLLLFGLIISGADGDGGHHKPDHLDCASDPDWQSHGGCMSAGRAAQLNHQQ